MTEIKLIYTDFPEPIESDIYQYYLDYLPENLRSKNVRYRRWQDRHTHLFGKILLIRLAIEYGLGSKVLNQLAYTQYDRPYLQEAIDFNISHTGTTVACAITRGAKIGLDIEQYSEVDFSDFSRIHSEEQWRRIESSPDPNHAFFELWTVKESVIKADGKGLSIPLDEIKVEHDSANQGGPIWYLKQLHLRESMAGCMACDKEDFKIFIEKIPKKEIYAKRIC